MLAVSLLVWLPTTFAAGAGPDTQCTTGSISAITKAGDYITSGSRTFHLLGQDYFDPTLWHAGDKLLICPDATKSASTHKLIVNLTNTEREETLVAVEKTQ